MSIPVELSSDVAAAVISHQHGVSSARTNELVNIILEVHATLRQLTAETRQRARRRFMPYPEPPLSVKHTTAGDH